MNNLDIQFSVIGITETWLRDSAHLVDINGFNFLHKHRLNRSGGGVGLYLSNNFEFKTRDDICFDEITEIAKSFISCKAAGYDTIPISIIKKSINIISEPLIHIINLSIIHGIVPDEMKIARVIPLFKDDRAVFTNYRPVSILPSFSKFLEKIIYNRILDYLIFVLMMKK